MLQKLRNTIKEYNMINKNEHIVIGVSGGADSMCLLHLLKEISLIDLFYITVVHVHHGIRGEEADQDAYFVQNMCEKWGVPFLLYHLDIKSEAKKRKCSEEEAGRILRYEIFENVRNEIKGSKIAVAHNMNDQAETILMQLFRGSGMKGLGGISYVRGYIIRPLLEFTREEIEDYCIKNNINYRQDYTNALNIYTRNKVRNELIPFVKENFNPNIIKVLHNMSTIVREEEAYLNEQASDDFRRCVKEEKKNFLKINNPLFSSKHPVIQNRMIRIALKRLTGHLKNIEYRHILDVIQLSQKGTGRKIYLPNEIVVKRQYEDLTFQIGEEEILPFSYELPIPGIVFIKELGKKVETQILSKENFALSGQNAYTKSFDYDKIRNGLCVRTKHNGDRILFEHGTKKLKDFFIDEKVPRDEREKMPLLADGNHILWIIGHRYSDVYKVCETTDKILQVRIFA